MKSLDSKEFAIQRSDVGEICSMVERGGGGLMGINGEAKVVEKR